MKILFTFLAGLIPIGFFRKVILNLLGHKISYKSKIGLNILLVRKIRLDQNSKIGYFNFIKIDDLILQEFSFINNFNYLKGPFNVLLNKSAGISNQNKIRRSAKPTSYGNAVLHLGFNSFIVANHFLDLTTSIYIGDNSIIAGINSQLWTHGYYHADIGANRIRIDGEINIGNNVYIGSGVIFNPGVKISDAIHIGAGSIISKDLSEKGMYVSQPLRHIKNDIDTIKSKLEKVKGFDTPEDVYTKNG